MILSVSRRTDIPAYYSKWFLKRLSEGYALVRNPMNYHSVSKINLSPEIVDCIVFWSKNPEPMVKYLTNIDDKYMYYFQYTINAYNKDVEPNIPSLNDRIRTFINLSERLGKERVIWRYDPIILTDIYTSDWHEKMFSYIADRLKGYTNNCVFSFVDMYDKIKFNMRNLRYRDIDKESINSLAECFAQIAESKKICLKTCSEDIDFSELGIQHSCCIDPELISKLINSNIKEKKDKNQRESCGCVESIDIGQYNTCQNSCLYCYANYSQDSVKANCFKHDINSPLLIGNLEVEDKISERKVESLKDNQLRFF